MAQQNEATDPGNSSERLMTAEEVNERLRVGDTKRREFEARGFLKKVKIGKRGNRYHPEDVRECIRLLRQQSGK